MGPQYEGGLIANPSFDKGVEAWKVDGHVKIEARESGGNKFIVAYNRTTPFSISQSFNLKEGVFYTFSGKKYYRHKRNFFILIYLLLKHGFHQVKKIMLFCSLGSIK